MAKLIQHIGELCDTYDYFIIDIFGVLHNGITVFPDTVKTLQALKMSGKELCLLSNSPRRAQNASNQMESMGIPKDLYDHIVTSGESTHDALKNKIDDFHKSCGHDCWFIGKHIVEEIVSDIDGIRLHDGPENASFILNAIPGTSPPEVEDFKKNLRTALEKDMPMICANPDLVVHVGDTLYECAGTFAKIYEDMGGRVVYHGKPHAPVYERCYELLGRPEKSKICAIGDAFHTDIAGANNFGIDSILNLDGIHREEVNAETIEHLDKQPHQPTYLIHGFVW